MRAPFPALQLTREGAVPPAATHLGITVPPNDLPVDELPALARRAEALGYTELWTYERELFDAFSPLAAAAAVTERIRLGTSIANVYTRPAALTAMSAASVAQLAPGRFVLGLGPSTETVVERWMGLDYERPLRRVRATVDVVRRLLAGERVGEMRLHRPPAEGVPVYLAALGPRMLRLAGRVADGVLFFFVGPRAVRGLVAATGRRFEAVAKLMALDSEDPGEDLALARRAITRYALLAGYGRALARQAFEEEVQAIRARWADGDHAGAARQVSRAMIDELVLMGPAERWPERIALYRAAGVTPDLWIQSTSASPERRRADFERMLETLAPVRARPIAVGSEPARPALPD